MTKNLHKNNNKINKLYNVAALGQRCNLGYIIFDLYEQYSKLFHAEPTLSEGATELYDNFCEIINDELSKLPSGTPESAELLESLAIKCGIREDIESIVCHNTSTLAEIKQLRDKIKNKNNSIVEKTVESALNFIKPPKKNTSDNINRKIARDSNSGNIIAIITDPFGGTTRTTATEDEITQFEANESNAGKGVLHEDKAGSLPAFLRLEAMKPNESKENSLPYMIEALAKHNDLFGHNVLEDKYMLRCPIPRALPDIEPLNYDEKTFSPVEFEPKNHLANLKTFFQLKNCGVTAESIQGKILDYAEYNHYNPLHDWLEGIVWDGIERLPTVYENLTGATEEKYGALYMKLIRDMGEKDFIGITARASILPWRKDIYLGGVSRQHMTILQGVENGIGKSFFIKNIFPDISGVEWYQSLKLSELVGNKDEFVRKMVGCAIWTLEELYTNDGKQLDALKDLLQEDKITVRPLYRNKKKSYAFGSGFASSNRETFFLDDFDRRNFFLICEGQLNVDWYIKNRIQILAEGYYKTIKLIEEGGNTVVKLNEYLRIDNNSPEWRENVERFTGADNLNDKIKQLLTTDDEYKFTATNLLIMPLSKLNLLLGQEETFNKFNQRYSKIARELNLDNRRLRIGGERIRFYCDKNLSDSTIKKFFDPNTPEGKLKIESLKSTF